jgi:uncharacterized protein YjbI with pentapeptide repeats
MGFQLDNVLKIGVNTWNEQKLASSEPIVIKRQNVSGYMEYGQYGADGESYADLRHIDLENVILQECVFQIVDFTESNFKNAQFIDCIFEGCIISDISVDNTSFLNVIVRDYFEDREIVTSTIKSINFAVCNFINVTAYVARLEGVKIDHNNYFKGIRGICRLFENCEIENIHLDGIELNAEFNFCKIERSSFKDIVISSTFYGINESELNRVEFISCQFDKINFHENKIVDVSFKESTFNNVSLSKNIFDACGFKETTINECTFKECSVLNSRDIGKINAIGKNKIDTYTLTHSDPFPNKILETCNLDIQTRKKFSLESNALKIEFNENTWPQLIPLEIVLSHHLGNRYKIIKNTNIISLEFFSNEDLQIALDAIMPILTSFEKVFPGNVTNITVSPLNENEVSISKSEIKELLTFLLVRFEMQFPIEKKELSVFEGTMAEAIKEIPLVGGVTSFWLEKWLQNREISLDNQQSKFIETFQKFKAFFENAKNLIG